MVRLNGSARRGLVSPAHSRYFLLPFVLMAQSSDVLANRSLTPKVRRSILKKTLIKSTYADRQPIFSKQGKKAKKSWRQDVHGDLFSGSLKSIILCKNKEAGKMDNLYHFLAQTFGPLVQLVFSLFILFLASWCICAIASWSEGKLILTGNRILWTLPFPILVFGLLYGGLRFSGQLLYPTDGWDQWGLWNYTNQNRGAYIFFIFVCLSIGVVSAVRKGMACLKS